MTAFEHSSWCNAHPDQDWDPDNECDCSYQPCSEDATAEQVAAWAVRHGNYMGAEIYGSQAPEDIAVLVIAALTERGHLVTPPRQERK